MKVKRCQSMRHGNREVYECERERGHKGKHRVTWFEGFGAYIVKLVARWP